MTWKIDLMARRAQNAEFEVNFNYGRDGKILLHSYRKLAGSPANFEADKPQLKDAFRSFCTMAEARHS
ncbi:MAG: hypothetical protein FJX35_18115 [Alphaproteobacteria bacterium]|nr:hypothetical protein [Alphaproteobacteria bacterium]